MKGDEQTEEGLQHRSHAPFLPSESWIEAIDRQCNAALIRRLERYAFRWARMIGGEDDPRTCAEELVQDALTDTMHGLLHWDPARVDLELHLRDVIRLRLRRGRRYAERFHFMSIDSSDPDDPTAAMALAEASLSQSTEAENAYDIDSLMSSHMSVLRGYAANDELVTRFLGALAAGATSRTEVMTHGSMNEADYRNARRRLARLVHQLAISSEPYTES